MSRERRLGRGLKALFEKGDFVDATSENGESKQTGLFDEFTENYSDAENLSVDESERLLQEKLKSKTPGMLDIMLIDRNPYQPRQDFDTAELDQLAASISTHGLLQPIVVRQNGDRFQIIAGERRFRAVTRAGWSEVPVHVLSVDDRQMSELALTENIQRKDLNAMEKAAAFSKYLEIYGGTHEELASRLELDRSTISNLLRLLDLPQEIQAMVRKNEISQGHARAILPLEDQDKLEICGKIVKESWNVRQTEKSVKELIESRKNGESSWAVVGQNGERQPVDKPNPHLQELEQEFRHRLGTKVKLTQSGQGKGKLVIPFTSNEEFERIYKLICRAQKNRDVG